MSSWIQDSPRLSLGLTAVVSGALAASAVIGLQNAKKWYSIHDLKGSIPDASSKHDVEKINDFGGAAPRTEDSSTLSKEDERGIALARRARLGDYDEALILEQLARNRVFLTDEGLHALRNAFVIIVGCGGVGSHAAAALARSGCGRIRLIDFDQVTLSSLNRHAVATLADVGTPKVACLQRRLEQIVPWTHFDAVNQLYSAEASSTLLGPWPSSSSSSSPAQTPSFVIDAIDNIDSKVALLAHCHAHSLPVISSMGAGCKSDPTRVFIGDISASTDDPLSRSTRRRLRLQGVKAGIPVIYSAEKTAPGKAQLLPLPEEQYASGSASELGILPSFRARILPVLGTMPAVFGLCAANHVMLSLASYPGAGEYISSKGREKMYDGILAQLQGLEERLARSLIPGFDATGLRIPVNAEDVGYLVDEVWRGRSAISGLTSRLALVRWRKPRGEWVDTRTEGQKAVRVGLDELVCVTKDEMLAHERRVLKGDEEPEEVYGREVAELVERRWAEEREYRAQRG